MDAVDRQLIQALRENGRASYAELGRLVGLSGPRSGLDWNRAHLVAEW